MTFCLARDSSSRSSKTLFAPPTRIITFSDPALYIPRALSSPCKRLPWGQLLVP